MRASTIIIAGFNAAMAMAQPNPNTYENIDIADFWVRKWETSNSTTINSVSFKLTGDDATALDCSASNPEFPSEVITCGDSKYRFALKQGETTEFALDLYHELGLAVGFYGEGDVPTYCHAGGAGMYDFACSQVEDTTIVIDGM